MNTAIRTTLLLLTTSLLIISCANAPAPEKGPYNDADSQRSRAGQAQGEMSSDTSK